MRIEAEINNDELTGRFICVGTIDGQEFAFAGRTPMETLQYITLRVARLYEIALLESKGNS